jgi:hypothetical protein
MITTPTRTQGRNGKATKIGHVPISREIVYRPLSSIRPSPENDQLYKPIDTTDPDFLALVKSVKANGVREALFISIDDYIGSGHRRYAAAKKAGLETVPCRTAEIRRGDPGWLQFLRDCNMQRVKSLDEVLREEVVSADPEEAYRRLRKYRADQADVSVDTIEMGDVKRRARITKAKRPFLDAILRIIEEYKASLPLSVRQIHYYLLNNPPLIHASKPGSIYCNNMKSYKAADELTIRARITGEIPISGAIHDVTRPVVKWNVHANSTPFIRAELDGFLKGYYRNLMQSQPNHIEIIGEKNTIDGVIRPVAADYTLTYTIGRGYSSLPPRHEMAMRFRRSGKEKLILLVLSDFDPEGEDVGRSFAQSMRDDFGITNIVPVKVALTGDQVAQLNLPPGLKAKKNSSRRKGFVDRHGENVFELEAVPPTTLQRFLRETIDSLIDIDAYNAEVDREKEDAAFLDGVRQKAHRLIGSLE